MARSQCRLARSQIQLRSSPLRRVHWLLWSIKGTRVSRRLQPTFPVSTCHVAGPHHDATERPPSFTLPFLRRTRAASVPSEQERKPRIGTQYRQGTSRPGKVKSEVTVESGNPIIHLLHSVLVVTSPSLVYRLCSSMTVEIAVIYLAPTLLSPPSHLPFPCFHLT